MSDVVRRKLAGIVRKHDPSYIPRVEYSTIREMLDTYPGKGIRFYCPRVQDLGIPDNMGHLMVAVGLLDRVIAESYNPASASHVIAWSWLEYIRFISAVSMKARTRKLSVLDWSFDRLLNKDGTQKNTENSALIDEFYMTGSENGQE